MGLSNGKQGQEQFTVTTRVNGELIKAQPIHDPFANTRVILRGFKHAWRTLTKGIEVQVSIDGSHGAIQAVMTLEPRELEDRTQLFLEQQAQRRADNTAMGILGYCSER